MSWFNKLFSSSKIRVHDGDRKTIPEGLWAKCTQCDGIIFKAELKQQLWVCPKCQHHMPIKARERLANFFDEDTAVEIAPDLLPVDTLKFKDRKRYKDRLSAAQKATGEKDALIAFSGQVHGIPCIAAAFEFQFIGGSMGQVVGEKFVQAVNMALEKRCPLVCFAASGGARMQESLLALMQMAKTAAALKRLKKAQLPYIVVLLNPCMGGVSASLAMLGDVNLAEPKALIGFTGPRVIEQTLRETLPEGFQSSEFLLEHGAVDQIVHRHEIKSTVARWMAKLTHQPAPNA